MSRVISRSVDAAGVRLHVEERGAGEAVVILHGFTGSTRSMAGVSEGLARSFRTIAIDLIGHGQSDAPMNPDEYSMAHCISQLCAVLDALDLRRVHLLGYSMGGRVALSLCAAQPERVASALLVGASAGLADEMARAERRRADAAWAARIENEGLAAFVDAWMAQLLFASQQRLGATALAAAREERLSNRPHGLALSLHGMGTGAQPPLHARLREIAVPICLAVGDEDPKFREIAQALLERLPQGELALIPGAGHAAHLENPEAFLNVARRFYRDAEVCDTEEDPRPMTTPQNSPNWKTVRSYEDIRYEKAEEGLAKITICRPEVRNAFRPKTLFELIDAFSRVREDPKVGAVLFTGEGPDAFCSGGDQRVRGDAGYVGEDGVPRLNALDLQRVIRSLPKPVIALVAGYAIGGGHVLHLLCDLTIAADNARFGQTGPRVGSFDAGFGAAYMARIVGQKKAREIWFLCRQYDAQQALDMGLVNEVVPLEELEATGVQWGREILRNSPIAIRCLKAAFNADCDGQAGLQELAGNATMLFYMSEEAQEGRDAFVEKRPPDFSKFPWRP